MTDNKFYIQNRNLRHYRRGTVVNENCLNIGSYKKNFVPLTAINRPSYDNNNISAISFDPKYKDIAKHYESLSFPVKKALISMCRQIMNASRWNSLIIKDSKNYYDALDIVKKNFDKYIKDPFYYKIIEHSNNWGDTSYYDDLFDHFWKGEMNNQVTFRSRSYPLSYSVSPYLLSSWNKENGNMEILVAIVTKPKYMPIIRASFILDEPIDTRLLQLWVRDDFDIPHTEFKNIRPRYRKQIKAVCADAGMPIIDVTKKDFLSLFNHYTMPKTNNPKEYKECTSNLYNQFITNEGDDFTYLNNLN